MNEQKPFIIQFVVGVILGGAGIITHFDYYSTMLFAVGIGLACSAAVQFIRIIYWKNPKRQDEYMEKKQQAHIDSIDERKQLLRMKAGHITYQIMTLLLLGLAFIFALFRVSPFMIAVLFVLFIFSWLIGTVVYHMLEKRM